MYHRSIGRRYNGDLSALIAPRTLIVVGGKEDEIFPIDGVRAVYQRAKEIFKAADAENNCMLIETEEAHYWCEDIVWNAIDNNL